MTMMDLKPLVDETLALTADKANGASDEELQPRFHELLNAMANAVDRDEMNNHSNKAFRVAVAELRRHSFIIHYDGPEKFDQMEELRKALAWPPVLPRIALIINLVRYLLLESKLHLECNYHHTADFEFTSEDTSKFAADKARNGWRAFYSVFGDLILAV